MEKENNLMVANSTEVTSPATLNMIESFRYVDDETRAKLVKHPSLIARIFPSVKQKMINDIQNRVLEENAEMYLDSVRILGQFQLQGLQEELNDRLMRGAAVIRTETIKLAQAKLVEVSANLSCNQQKLIIQIERDLEFCKGIKNSYLKSKYENAILRLTDEFFDTFERLSEHFKQFLDLKIGGATK